MPANLPPDYLEAEKRFREARTSSEKIATLEEMLAIVPKHKETDKLRADLRRRLSKLKDAAQTRKGPDRFESVFQINKEGAGQVAVVGAANVGKSALVALMTNAAPEVADYPHTTWRPTPGMMAVENIQIQLVDTPALNREYVEPELVDLIRRTDLILLLVDLQTDPVEQLQDTVTFLEANRIVPLRMKDRYSGQRGFTFIPVYSKAPGKEPERDTPFVLKKGSTVLDFAEKIHNDFVEKFKVARVWGKGVFDGQMVQRDHVLQDGDIVELNI